MMKTTMGMGIKQRRSRTAVKIDPSEEEEKDEIKKSGQSQE
jgi:hypothetical protein